MLNQIKNLLELEVNMLNGQDILLQITDGGGVISNQLSVISGETVEEEWIQDQVQDDNIGTQDDVCDGNSKIENIKQQISLCEKCSLSSSRTNIVFGEGNITADLMFIGEAPGYEEDRTGRPFVGKAGQLLTKMINAINMKREDVYIANILKCRPPNNRAPQENEIKFCIDYLYNQIKIVEPKVICALGPLAAKTLLDSTEDISSLRGKKYNYNNSVLIPTFHPSYLLRNEGMKKYAWHDLKLVMQLLEADS